MIRAFILFFNFSFLVLVNWFSGPVSIDLKMPSSVKAGSEYTVEIVIKKGTIGGFARFQHELPEGFTAQAGELSGSGFTFEAQKVKFVWASLPGDKTLKVSYTVKVPDNVSGDFVINGKFSYIQDGNSASELTTNTIHVVGPPKAAGDSTNTQGTKAVDNTAVNTVKPDSTIKPAAVITCIRTVPTAQADKEFTVEIRLNKASVTGFAKIEDELPAGYTATALATANAEFKFEKQKVKFIWYSLPSSDKELVLSYKVTFEPSDKTELKINGLFSYIENEEPKKFYLAESTVSVKAAALADNTVPKTTPTDTKVPDTNTTTDTGRNTGTDVAKTTTAKEPVNPDNSVTGNIPGADKGVNYKVQIMALHRSLESAYFTKTYGITENIAVEMHEGYTKFTVGGFPEYGAARDHREVVKGKGVVGPFVTAYNSGKRITVQEALMISNQKWVR